MSTLLTFYRQTMRLKWNIIFVLAYYLNSCQAYGNDDIILTEDRAYEVINFRIPSDVWKKAIRPTPLLKSQATIVLPVHVSHEIENDNEDEDEIVSEENDITQADPAAANPETVQDVVPVVADPTVATPVNDVPQAPILEGALPEPPYNDDDVTGSVTRFPCECRDGQCGCCTGMMLQRLRMNACGNMSFVPEDFVFDVRLTVNNNTVVRRRVSASDPPPICFNPRRLPFVRVCAEISNIRVRNRNAFACLDINADIGGFSVYSASFRCFGLGSSGVQTGLKPKPVSSGPAPVNLFGNGEDASPGFVQEAAEGIVQDTASGIINDRLEDIFGGDDEDGGPLGAIGDAVGGLFGGE